MNNMASPYPKPTSRIGRFPWLMFLFVAAVFFLAQHDLFYSNKISQTFNPTEDDLIAGVLAGSLSRRIAFLALGLLAVAGLMSLRGVRLRINGSLGRIILFFAGWTVLSVAWAEDPALTSRRLVVFAILCLSAAAIARQYSLRQIVLLTFFCSILFLLIGVSAEIALGTFRPFMPGYRFAGTLHPNHQGINCALLLLSGLAAADTEKRGRPLFRACALLGLIFLILTASRTSFAAILLAVAAYLAAVSSRRAKTALGLGLGIASCALLLVLGNALLPGFKNAVMLGRDDSTVDSFNGRSEVWEEVGYYIHRRPTFGYGWGGFWTEAHITEISATQKWGVGEAHSAYLDCALSLGLVGLVAYVFALLVGVGRSFVLHRASQNSTFAFAGAFLIFCLADGLLESAPVGSASLIFLVAAVLIHLGFRPLALVRVRQDSLIAQPRRNAQIHKGIRPGAVVSAETP